MRRDTFSPADGVSLSDSMRRVRSDDRKSEYQYRELGVGLGG